jgi:hydrogenase maturation factor
MDVIGGHTEVTYGIDRPILVSTVIGEVPHDELITPKGALAGDHILVTKGIPIEATALLAREFPERLSAVLTPEEIALAQQYLFEPGISVFKDARIAVQCGGVHAMHDPTEGGIATALLEMATASQKQLVIDPTKIPMPALSLRICRQFGLDPLGTIASGALLLAVDPSIVDTMLAAYQREGILAADIGFIRDGASDVLELHDRKAVPLRRFARDEITRVYETAPATD